MNKIKKKYVQYTLASFTAICMAIMSVSYVVSIIIGNTVPTIMTWIFFAIAVSMSFATYWRTENHSILGNIANFVDIFFVGIILTTTVIVYIKRHIAFEHNIFIFSCIAIVICIGIYWVVTKSHNHSFYALQVMMIVAYFPMIYNLWHANTCTEPLIPWFINLLAGVSNVSIGYIAKDKYSKFYSWRMIIMLSIVIALIIRVKYFI